MGQKIHPGGMRVGVIHDWKSNWYTGKKEFPAYLLEDVKIREHIYKKLAHAGLSDILIRKDKQRITVDIYTARPGIVIGKSGVEVDALRKELHALTQKNVHININEIKRPELDAKLVAQSIAEQLSNRVAFRRAMKRALASAIRSGAAGVKIQCSGRLGGGEMSRRETYSEGRVPLHTIRADIDYGFVEAKTDVRPHRRQGLDQQGRDHARGLRRAPAATTRASATRTHAAVAAARSKVSARRARAAAAAVPIARASARCASAGAGPAAAVPAARAAAAAAGGRGPGAGARPAGGGAVRAATADRQPRRKRRQAPRTRRRPSSETPKPVTRRRPSRRRPPEKPKPSRRAEAPETAGADGHRDEPKARRASRRSVTLMLMPKKTKFRKVHRGRRRGDAKGQTTVQFGDYGLKAIDARLDHEPPDRGGSYRDDAQDQARRQGLDQRLPRQERSRRSPPRPAWAPARARPRAGSP